MTEILSQDEIDSLLAAISAGEVDTTEYAATQDQRKVKIWDFKRPNKFSKDQLRNLQMIHETFTRLVTTTLAAQLRAVVNIHTASVDQISYEEFMRSIPNPTTIAVINMDPLKGSAVLEIDPQITFTIIDKLFGGKGESMRISRELSDIEISVMESVITRLLGNLREAWASVIDLRPRLGLIETNPQFTFIVPHGEMVILISLETRIGDTEGLINICLPHVTLEPLIPVLSAQYLMTSVRTGPTDEYSATLQERLENVELQLKAELGEAKITTRELLELRKGDVIKLPDTKLDSDMYLRVGSRKKYKCRAGTIGNRKAVQIGEAITEIPDEVLLSSRKYGD